MSRFEGRNDEVFENLIMETVRTRKGLIKRDFSELDEAQMLIALEDFKIKLTTMASYRAFEAPYDDPEDYYKGEQRSLLSINQAVINSSDDAWEQVASEHKFLKKEDIVLREEWFLFNNMIGKTNWRAMGITEKATIARIVDRERQRYMEWHGKRKGLERQEYLRNFEREVKMQLPFRIKNDIRNIEWEKRHRRD